MENKNGQGIFLGVVGVATLVVAIIGATFAFFSAQAQSGANDLKGGTLDIASSALKLEVKRVKFTDAASNNENLVPADFGASVDSTKGNSATATGIGYALSHKCQTGSYTGCHVYRISAIAGDDLADVSLNLTTLTVTTAAGDGTKTDWKYALFTASETATGEGSAATYALSSPALVNVTNAQGAFDLPASVNMHTAGTLTKDQEQVYYLIVYLNNETSSQNTPSDANNGTGTYQGSVTLKVGQGEVNATFTSAA